eukprot:1395242-Amorphochlora_amoeboformis.AAC.1
MGLCQGRERTRVEILARDLEVVDTYPRVPSIAPCRMGLASDADLKRKNASYLDRLTDFENNLGEQFNQINQNLLGKLAHATC